MLGTIVNTITITLGALVGSVVKKGIKPQYQDAMYTAMGLSACAIGMNGVATHMSQSQYPVLFIISLALGSLLGTILDLNGRFQGLVNQRSKSNLGQGLSTGILMYCIGTLSILGPVMAAVNQDYTYLFTNATLDFVTSMVLAYLRRGHGVGCAGAVLLAGQHLVCSKISLRHLLLGNSAV